jgi:ssDNA-binding Zn-finger/Zn-ribbon topoisomerase 1
MVIKTGRFGKFLACSRYPECRNTRRIAPPGGEKGESPKASPTGDNCEKCGSPLVYRKGRFGPFIACSNYPRCRFTKKIAKVPQTGGEAGQEVKSGGKKTNAPPRGEGVEKKTRKKRIQA